MGGNSLTETFTCVSSFLAHIYVYEYATHFFVLGLHGGFQECHLVHGPFSCEHDGVMVLWRSVCGTFGHGSRLQRHHQCISTICSVLLCPVEQVLLHSSAMNSVALTELWIVILVSRAPLQASSPSSWRDGMLCRGRRH